MAKYTIKDGKGIIDPGSTVIEVGEFSSNSELTSIVIPRSVTRIGNGAFAFCSGLTSIVIPDSVTEIGIHTFWGCTSLTSIVIPNSVTEIGIQAFLGCTSLTSIVIPNSVKKISNNAFMGCTSLTSVVISDSVTEIGDYAFQSTGLTSIEIPNSVKRIGEGAFSGCAGLTSIVISDSVTEIGTNAFWLCSGLRQASILGPVKKINWLFRYCSALETVTFGVGIDGFDEDMFMGCESLKAIYVPAKKTDYYARRLYALPHGNSLCKLIVELPAEKRSRIGSNQYSEFVEVNVG